VDAFRQLVRGTKSRLATSPEALALSGIPYPQLVTTGLPRWSERSAWSPMVVGGQTKMLIILLVILLLMSLGSLPTWPHSRDWGYYPSGGLGLVVVILVVLLLLGRI
jgi:hypothetical protein